MLFIHGILAKCGQWHILSFSDCKISSDLCLDYRYLKSLGFQFEI